MAASFSSHYDNTRSKNLLNKNERFLSKRNHKNIKRNAKQYGGFRAQIKANGCMVIRASHEQHARHGQAANSELSRFIYAEIRYKCLALTPGCL